MIYLRSCLGVEIRQEDLMISCLQSNLSGGVFTHFARIPSFRSRDRAEVRREIQAFFKAHKIARENLVLGIPNSEVIVRHLDLPAEVMDNLRQVVLYQVQSFEPTEEEKFYYDYHPLRSEQNGKRIAVLLIMIRKSVLDALLALLKEIGMSPSMVTANSVALANLFLQNRKDFENKTFMLADVSQDGLELLTLRDGGLAYCHRASRRDSIGWKDLILSQVEEAAGKIRLQPGDTIESIVLSGPDSEEVYQEVIPELQDCELLARRLRFEMPATLRSQAPAAATSLGLAYSGLSHRPAARINLLPEELRLRRTRWAYVPAILLGIVIVILLGALGLRRIVQGRYFVEQLDTEIQALKPSVDRVLAVRNQAQTLERRIDFTEKLMRERDMNLEVLKELSNILPSDTFLTLYQNEKGIIQISGSSSSAPDLIPKLEQSPLLKDVVQRGTIFKNAQNGKDQFTFEAKLETRK